MATCVTEVEIRIHYICIFLTYAYFLIHIFGRVKERIYIKPFKIQVHQSTCKIHKLVDRLHASYKNCALQNQCCV